MQKSERIVRYTAEQIDEKIRNGEDRTNWERVRNLTFEEIEASIDFEEEGIFDWSTVQAGMPDPSQEITVRFDAVVIDWFKAQGPDYEDRMNAVLHQYMDRMTSTQSHK
ncbi:MAG: BrnA antitoxin family protein [Chloroflexia bacterium]|nr:BrnA antitoxin family protein [Chloroflexia bacterium]